MDYCFGGKCFEHLLRSTFILDIHVPCFKVSCSLTTFSDIDQTKYYLCTFIEAAGSADVDNNETREAPGV